MHCILYSSLLILYSNVIYIYIGSVYVIYLNIECSVERWPSVLLRMYKPVLQPPDFIALSIHLIDLLKISIGGLVDMVIKSNVIHFIFSVDNLLYWIEGVL